MGFILLEGLDRSGKSTVAEMYKSKGFDVVHMSAPDKKYQQPGYSGPSYLEEIVNMYSIYDGKDVVFDRTPYGETIWPEIYNRQSLLTPEDLEYLRRLEYNNDVVRILMYDENTEAHWQRCVENKEPLNRLQFVQAGRLYDEMAVKFNFEKHQLGDFSVDESASVVEDKEEKHEASTVHNDVSAGPVRQSEPRPSNSSNETLDLEQRLERANAIRSLLKSSLIKKKGDVFAKLENDIKDFLEQELQDIFTEQKKDDFTQEEVQILKIYAQRIKEKLG